MATSTQNIAAHQGKEHQGGHSPVHYVRIWMILVILLIVSVLGSETGIQSVTLVSAFGIAFVKAFLVAKHFMHLNVEKRYVVYLLLAAVAFMVLFFFGTAADVMRHDGQNWSNRAAKAETERALHAPSHDAHSSSGAQPGRKVSTSKKNAPPRPQH